MILTHEIRGGYSEWYLRSQEVAWIRKYQLNSATPHQNRSFKKVCESTMHLFAK